MPATTDCRGLPYPVDADPIDVAADMERLAEATDEQLCSIIAGYPRGAISRQFKPTTQGGYGGATEFAISGLEFTVPAMPPSGQRLHQVEFNVRAIQTSTPLAHSITYVTLRAGSVTGTVVDNINFPSIDNASPHGISLQGTFVTAGLVHGQLYVITTGTSGGFTYSVSANSWSMLWDRGGSVMPSVPVDF